MLKRYDVKPADGMSDWTGGRRRRKETKTS